MDSGHLEAFSDLLALFLHFTPCMDVCLGTWISVGDQGKDGNLRCVNLRTYVRLGSLVHDYHELALSPNINISLSAGCKF